MRVCCLLALAVIQLAFAAEIGLNLPCNKELDGLLASDPDPTAFLSCVGVGVGKIGFWERKVCPNNMVFDFINQQCKAKSSKSKKSRKQQTLHIAILNNSCANGETCIGGTVCDLDTYRCLCPYGTVPQLDTLSCIKKDNNNYGETPTYGFNSYNNFENTVNGFSNTRTPDFLKPNPTYSKSTSDYNGNNFNYKNNFGPQDYSSQWKPNPDAGNSFLPNHKFIFQNLFSTTPAPTTTRKIPILAHPGQSCRQNEICSGGSICTLPIGLCLCPGELEARDGECVLPASASITVQKVGIGALCNELAECDHGATCVMGRCACVAPLVQHEGKCALRQERKEVGPGELCDNGEVCVRGSVCDVVIPVCVCPPETDLSNGECVHTVVTAAPKIAPVAPIAPVVPTYVNAARVSYTPAPAPAVVTYTPPPSGSPRTYTYVPRTTQSPAYRPATNPPTQPIINIHPTYVPPTRPLPQTKAQTFNYMSIATTTPTSASAQQTVKPNVMKIALGGSKQAGVGVRCALNTDCMIGAYCNGNTNPPSCQCLSTHVNIEGRCEKVVYPGQIGCRSDQQCTAAYAGTSCIDRVCVCPTGFKAVDQTCVPANEPVTSPPGGSCAEARECTGGSVCREGWCICPDPTMIVQKGICIQSGPRPTLPAKTVPVYTTRQPSVYSSSSNLPTYNSISQSVPSRKIAAGSSCGPLDMCVGGSTCIEGTCVCPATLTPINGRCELITTTTTVAPKVTPSYARPGETCQDGRICTGGSSCSDNKNCECPSDKPLIKGEHCHPPETKKKALPGESCDESVECTNNSKCNSGQCRCEPQFIAWSGQCIAVPMPTTPKMTTVAKPLENCEEGEVCTGGSSCDEDRGICMCPPGQIAFSGECKAPPSMTLTSASASSTVDNSPATNRPTTECENDSNCAPGKLCISGKCRCRPGTVDNAGICEPLEEMEVGERPVPISYARHRALSSERLTASESEANTEAPSTEPPTTTTEEPTTRPPTRAPSRQATQRPRIVGPPIRRPKPKTKSGGSSGGSGGGTGPGSYKTGGTGAGNCPPGNEPTRDDGGKLIMCNGLEPNCPPRSYCYITSGGFATEEYNCCKSW